jgi:Sigma-70 region 3
MTLTGMKNGLPRPKSPSRGTERDGLTREPIIAPSPRVDAGRRIVWTIREALMNEQPTDRLPASVVGLLARMRRADRALRRELGRAPAFEEVAASLGLSAAQKALVTWALRSGRMRPSGDRPGAEDGLGR